MIAADGTEVLVPQPPELATADGGGAALRELRITRTTTFSGWFFPETELAAGRQLYLPAGAWRD